MESVFWESPERWESSRSVMSWPGERALSTRAKGCAPFLKLSLWFVWKERKTPTLLPLDFAGYMGPSAP